MQNVGPKNRVVLILLRNPYIGGQKLSNPSLNNNLFRSFNIHQSSALFRSQLFVQSFLTLTFPKYTAISFNLHDHGHSPSWPCWIPISSHLDAIIFRPFYFSASLLSSSRVRDADCSRSYETLHPLWSHWPFPRQAPERWTFCGPSNF